MSKLKNLLILIAFLAISTSYSAEHKKANARTYSQADFIVEETESNKEQRLEDSIFAITSSDGAIFRVKYDTAIQSELLRESLNNNQKNIDCIIHSNVLEPLLRAMQLIYEYKTTLERKQLYEFVQANLFNHYSLEALSAFFYAARALNFELLENLFLDRMAQIILYQCNMCGGVEKLIPFIQPEHAYLIEKYYYLRSDKLKPKAEDLLINKNEQLKNHFNINTPENLKTVSREIFKQMNLSINDLLDYQKSIYLDEDYELDLSDFFLSNLHGLHRISEYDLTIVLYLNNNLLTDLNDHLENLDNLDHLDLSNNLLTTVEDQFYALTKLSWLKLGDNKLTSLGTSLDRLEELIILDLDNNLLTTLADSLKKLTKLEILYLKNNKIADLGTSLLGFKKLKILNIENNKIKNIVSHLSNLENFHDLSLKNNPINQSEIEYLEEDDIEFTF